LLRTEADRDPDEQACQKPRGLEARVKREGWLTIKVQGKKVED